jgi:adenine-specific DNA-methyltransferase
VPSVRKTILKKLSGHAPAPRVDPDRRRELGIYYTPRNAADILAFWAIRTGQDTILEPSFGGCSILEAALDRLRDLGCSTPLAQLCGFDVDRTAFAHLSRLLMPPIDVSRFRQQDFLTASAAQVPGTVTAVIGNPPFVSYHRMNNAQRLVVRNWRDKHRAEFPMTASLWAYFLVHALSFLAPKGRLAFVLPAAAITADYGKPLLCYIEKRFARVLVFRLGQQLFMESGAEERTVLLFAEGYSQDGIETERLQQLTATSVAELDGVVRRLLEGPVRNLTDLPSDASDRTWAHDVLESLRQRGDLCLVGDIAKVAIGEVVGDTAFFVRRADVWRALRVPERHLRPIVTRTRQLPGVQISERDVGPLYGTLPFLLIAPQRRTPQNIRMYLSSYSPKARNLNRTFAKRQPWYNVSYDPTAKAFIGSLSHDAPRIVLNDAKVSCGNGLYKLTPQPGVLWRRVIAAASLTTVFAVSSELRARIRGSGALKLEPSDVLTLLVPASLTSFAADQVKELLQQLDVLLRRNKIDSANRIADEALLIGTGIVNRADLRTLRDILIELRAQRLPSR